MIYYVDAKACRNGDGSKERPFKTINAAAKLAVAVQRGMRCWWRRASIGNM